MDYFSEIVEDDSTLVLNNYGNYGDIFDDDSLDSHSVSNAKSNENIEGNKQDDTKIAKIIGDLHDAEEIVVKILAKNGKLRTVSLFL